MLKIYTVSNLSYLPKGIEKVIYIRGLGHILDYNIVDSFQSASGHSCEMVLLRVYTDSVTTNDNGSYIVLLDLSDDMIDHDNLF